MSWRRTAVAILAVLALAGCGATAGGGEGGAGSGGGSSSTDGGAGGGGDSPDVGEVDTAMHPCPAQPARPAEGAQTLPPLAFDCFGGGSLDLARAPGVPTVVNLWASWCGPCRTELPVLQHFADAAHAAGDRVQVLGVVSRDGVPQANSFAADSGVTFPSAFDGSGDLMAELGLPALPATYFLDADGALVHTEVGPVSSVDELSTLVAEQLGVRL